jgi:hypothetical protein
LVSRVATTIPDENALLCEGCGYILSGLPAGSRCPECAKPMAESLPETRGLPPWEQNGSVGAGIGLFLRTLGQVLCRPTWFFRGLVTRADLARSRRFARINNAIVSLLFGLAAYLQAYAILELAGLGQLTYSARGGPSVCVRIVAGTLVCGGLCYAALALTNTLAAHLSAWEAGYRGLRLPYAVVVRGLHYHSAHYLPVGIVAALTVGAYHILLRLGLFPITWETYYLYLLGAEVVLAAIFLFWTYWLAMRNMMYANR